MTLNNEHQSNIIESHNYSREEHELFVRQNHYNNVSVLNINIRSLLKTNHSLELYSMN